MNNTFFQQKAINKLGKLKVGALFMEMGTGKTKVALDLIASKKQKVDYVLWICPFSLKKEIEKEREKWQPAINLDIVGCESIGSSDRIYLETLEKVQNNNSFIVVDESLKIKNIGAKRTRRILHMGAFAKYKLILNGTPLSKNILDIWTQIEFLSPKILNMSYNEFKNTYCEYYLKGKLKGKVIRQCNIQNLISKIEPYIFDCNLEINTKKNYYTYLYNLNSKEDYEIYKYNLMNEYYNEFNDDLNFNAFAMKLQKFYSFHSDKQELIDSLIKKINDKVIIFVRFIDSIPQGSSKITGSENSKQRERILNDFKDGKFNALYITYGCGSYGLNLQFCRNIIFAEHIWDYAQRIQAESRIYRIGQGDEVNYYSLICDKVGLEDLIFSCINKKSNLLYVVKSEIAKKGVKEWVKSI